jgi:hypothetical protein
MIKDDSFIGGVESCYTSIPLIEFANFLTPAEKEFYQNIFKYNSLRKKIVQKLRNPRIFEF